MKNCRLWLLATFCLAFVNLFGQTYEPGVLRVRLKESYNNLIIQEKLRQGQFGLAEIDKAKNSLGVREIRRIFREAGKYEKAHRKYGLHLWYEVTFDANVPVSNAIQKYKDFAAFEVVEAKQRFYAVDPVQEKFPSTATPSALTGPTNDPMFNLQWHYKNTGQSGGTSGADISLEQAWAIQTGKPEVIVAVIDGGIDINHPDLQASIWVNTDEIAGNGIDDDHNGYIDDRHGYGFGDNTGTIHPHYHGTHVAGTIAAVTNNATGVAGIAGGAGTGNGVRLMSCAGFGSVGVGGFEDAMVYAADNGAVISQNSWGGGSRAIEAAIDYFVARAGLDNTDTNFDKNIQIGPTAGGVVIFAAGNSSSSDPNIGYPASYAPNIAVASTDHKDQKSFFSNFGSWVDISAPGSSVYSTYPVVEGSYAYLSGTSMACPHVSGVAALIISQFGGSTLNASQVRDRLLHTADDIDPLNPSYADMLGTGRVNAYNALQVNDDIPPAKITDLVVDEPKLSSIVLTWTATGASDMEGAASYYDIRFSTSPINASNFSSSQRVPNPPKPAIAGSEQTFEVEGLQHSTLYYFAIRAGDFFGNISALSNIVSGTTLLPPIIGVSPTSLSETLFTGASVTRNLTVSNTGSSNLYISVRSSTSVATAPATAKSIRVNDTRELNLKELKVSAESTTATYPFTIDVTDARYKPLATQLSQARRPLSAGRLFSLNHSLGKIVELDPATGTVVKQITPPEGFSGGPDGLAFDGSYLYYISGWGTNDIHKIDAETGELVSSLSLSSLPFIDALAHSGKYVYALDYSSYQIFEIDFDEGELVRTIDPGVGIGGGLTFAGQRGSIFVSNFSAKIYEISLETGEVVNSFTPAGTVYGLGYSDGLDILFAANVSTGQADAIDPNTGEVLYSLPGVLSAAMASDEGGAAWLSPDKSITTVLPGKSVQVPVVLNATGLNGGLYAGKVKISSNDPEKPLVEVPVTLTVLGAPSIALSSPDLSFGDVFIGASKQQSVVIRNNGTDKLIVEEIAVSGAPTFLLPLVESFSLNPEESREIFVSFSPTGNVSYTATITISSNDPDNSSVLVPLTGKGVNPPVLEVNPEEVTASLLTNERSTQVLALSNTGDSNLEWSLVVEAEEVPVSATSIQYFQVAEGTRVETSLNNSNELVTSGIASDAIPLAPGDFMQRAASPVPLTCVAVDPQTGIIYAQANEGYSFYKYDPLQNVWTALQASPLHSSNNGGAVYLNGKVYTCYTVNSTNIGVYTVATNTWTTISNGLLAGTGNITTDGTYVYMTEGSNFKRYDPSNNQWTTLAAPPFWFNRWGGLSYLDGFIYGQQGDGYSGFAKYNINSNTWTALPNLPGGAVLGSAIDPTDKKFYAYGSFGGTNWYAFDIAENKWSATTIPFFSINDGGLAYVGKSGVSGIYFVQGQSGVGFAKFETKPLVNWLSLDVHEGVTGSEKTASIQVTLDAKDLLGGDYTGAILVNSNDPIHPQVTVPVSLHVTGTPDIQVDNTSIDFGLTFTNVAKDTVIEIYNAGTDVLQISSVTSSNAAFSVSPLTLSIAPKQTGEITITLTATAPGDYTSVVTLLSNDHDEEELDVNLVAEAIDPPVFEVTPEELTVALLSNETATKTFIITNGGASHLSWDLELSTQSDAPSGSSARSSLEARQTFVAQGSGSGTNNAGETINAVVADNKYPLAPGDFVSRANSPVALTCIVADPTTGLIYGQANQGYNFHRYNPATNTWSTLASSPLYSGNNGGAVYLNGKIYTSYTDNSSQLGVYTIATNSWTTIGNFLSTGTGIIGTDGSSLYLLSANVFKRMNPSDGVVHALPAPPFYFNRWGGIAFFNGTFYAHQGDGSTGFAKFSVSDNTWTSLPNVPGGAVLGSALDPNGKTYYAYGSYGGTNWYAFNISTGEWSVTTIPLFQISDGGIAYLKRGDTRGVYFIQGEGGIGFAKYETTSSADWLSADVFNGLIPAGDSDQISVTIDATGMMGGDYSGELHFQSNDPNKPEVTIPVSLKVTGVPEISVSSSLLSFSPTYLNRKRDLELEISNNGTDDLVVSSTVFSNSVFSTSEKSFTLAAGLSRTIVVTFQPTLAQAYSASLTFNNNDPDESAFVVNLHGVGVPPPFTVTPAPIADTLAGVSTKTKSITIQNNTSEATNWTLSLSAGGDATLARHLQALKDSYTQITGLLTNLYDFSEGTSGSYINDGGSDMYDGGNVLRTNGAFNDLLYSNDNIMTSPALGSSGQYFTMKFPGLFVFAGDIDVSSFEINGNLGADGSGSVDGAILTSQAFGKTYKGFVKRVYNAWSDPSVNHLIIVEDNGLVSHSYPSNTDSDYHQVTNLTGIKRIYYLLFATASGGYVSNTVMEQIMAAYLQTTRSSPAWFSVSSSSGLLPAGGSTSIVGTFDIGALASGVYEAEMTIAKVGGGVEPLIIPVKMTNIRQPKLAVSKKELKFPSLYLQEERQSHFLFTNTGNENLVINDIALANEAFTTSTSVLSIAAGDSARLNVKYKPMKKGAHSSTVSLKSNDPASLQLNLIVNGGAIERAALSVTVDSASLKINGGAKKIITATLKNTGGDSLKWTLNELPGWITSASYKGSIGMYAEQDLKFTVNATDLEEKIYTCSLTFKHNNPLLPAVEYPITVSVNINASPLIKSAIADQIADVTEEQTTLDLSGYFYDPDDDVLKYRISSDNNQVADLKIDGNSLTIKGVKAGVSLVNITAEDPGKLHATASFKVTITAITGIEHAERSAGLSNTPNPFRERTTISYDLKNAGVLTLLVHDMNGKTIFQVTNERQVEGKKEFELSGDYLAAGLYVYHILLDGNIVASGKMSKY